MSKKLSRQEARENAFLLLFENYNGISSEWEDVFSVAEETLEIPQNKYTEKLCKGVTEKLPEIDELIEKFSSNWKKKRISKVAITAIRIAVFEMLEGLTPAVAISQAVGLARKYADPEIASFVNGLLGAIYKNNPDLFVSVEDLKNKQAQSHEASENEND